MLHNLILAIEEVEDINFILFFTSLSANGTRTWLVDINSETLKPPSWDELAAEKPMLDSFSDISIYELHIRDFRFAVLFGCTFYGILIFCMLILLN